MGSDPKDVRPDGRSDGRPVASRHSPDLAPLGVVAIDAFAAGMGLSPYIRNTVLGKWARSRVPSLGLAPNEEGRGASPGGSQAGILHCRRGTR